MTEERGQSPCFWIGLSNDIKLGSIVLTGVILAHFVSDSFDPRMALGGLAVLLIIVVGQSIARLPLLRMLPSLFWVGIVAIIVTWPGVPGSQLLGNQIAKVSFLPVITPLMAFAALGLTQKDIDLFRTAGVRFVIIALFVFIGTYAGSALIAEAVLRVTSNAG